MMRQAAWIVLGIIAAALGAIYGPNLARRTFSQPSPAVGSAPGSAGVDASTSKARPSASPASEREAAQFASGWNDVLAEAKAKQIPPAEQIQIYGQVLRSISHENYARFTAPILLSGTSDDLATQALWQDLRERPPGISLPVMAEIVSRPGHPLALAADQLLKLALRESYPEDPSKLRGAVQRFSAVR